MFQVNWGDGTSDKIYIDGSGNVGAEGIEISSDPNYALSARQKTIDFKTLGGQVLFTLDVEQEAAEGYVTDGLQLWYDGIQNTRNGHDDEPEYWEDLSGNENDAYIDSNLIDSENVYINHNNIRLEQTELITNDAITLDTFTFEVCLSNISNNLGTQCAVGQRTGKFTMRRLGFWRNQMTLKGQTNFEIERDGTVLTDTDNGYTGLNEPITFAFVKSNSNIWGYVNGTLCLTSLPYPTIGSAIEDIIHIGGFNGDNFTIADFHSVRIYNRALNAQELGQNAIINHSRFEIAL